MSRFLRVVAAIIAVQAALIGAYWLVGRERSEGHDVRPALGTAPPEEVGGTAPPLSLTGPDGGRVELHARDQPTLVHFWATWCPPCRDELTGLLTLARTHRVDVLAIALDDDWADVQRFLDGEDGTNVFLGDAEQVREAFGVHSLPVTFLMEPGARLRFRFDGARDWTDRRFVDRWLGKAHD